MKLNFRTPFYFCKKGFPCEGQDMKQKRQVPSTLEITDIWVTVI
jgi:hypothetical protein